jgi:serine protease Do
MHNEPEAMTRRQLRHVTTLGVALFGVAMLATSLAQAQGPDRDTVRVYRLQTRRGDTLYTSTLRATRQRLQDRVDSLRQEFEGLTFNAPERTDILQELRNTISALANLSLLEQNARARAANRAAVAAAQRASAEAMAEARAASKSLAGSVRVSIASLQPAWIGINAEAPQQRIVRGDSGYIRYFNYPRIVSVEPNSPAEQAGIERGDRILAYNGEDVRFREINLTRLLQPMRRITVRVERDGEEREFSVVPTRPPRQFVERLTLSMPEMKLDSMPRRIVVMPRGGSMAPGAGPMMLVDPMDPSFVPIAGAKLVEINSQSLGEVFGVSSGVLVTEVFTDPARSSGLRGGDVILGADHQEITRIAELRRIINAHSADRSVELEIMRHKRTQFLTLRW